MPEELIDADALPRWMKKVPEWELEDDERITRTFEFDEFREGIEFVNDVAEIAEEADHHPDIDIRWTRVSLTLTTHDAGGLTEQDFEVAQRIDTLVD